MQAPGPCDRLHIELQPIYFFVCQLDTSWKLSCPLILPAFLLLTTTDPYLPALLAFIISNYALVPTFNIPILSGWLGLMELLTTALKFQLCIGPYFQLSC